MTFLSQHNLFKFLTKNLTFTSCYPQTACQYVHLLLNASQQRLLKLLAIFVVPEPRVKVEETRHLLHLVIPVHGLRDHAALFFVCLVDRLKPVASEIAARGGTVTLPRLLAHPTEIKFALQREKTVYQRFIKLSRRSK